MFNKYFSLLLLACITFPLNASNIKNEKISSKIISNSTIQKVRIDFTTPTGYVRHLLLGFTSDDAATDGFDYGYDALNPDNFPDDLNWMIDNQRYVTQGVGAFNETKSYPLGLFLTNSGNIKIELASLENFTESINVYVFDSLLNTYTLINNQDYTGFSESGEFTERYYLTFIENTNENFILLSTTETQIENVSINYNKAKNQLYINTNNANHLDKVELYDFIGKRIYNIENIHSSTLHIPIYRQRSPYYIIRIQYKNKYLIKKIAVI